MKTAGNEVTVTKKELIDRISQQTGEKRSVVKRIVQEFLSQIVSELGSGHRLEFRDFGVFYIHERKARLAQNPKTLQRVSVPSKKVVKFKPGRRLKKGIEPQGHSSAGKAVPAPLTVPKPVMPDTVST